MVEDNIPLVNLDEFSTVITDGMPFTSTPVNYEFSPDFTYKSGFRAVCTPLTVIVSSTINVSVTVKVTASFVSGSPNNLNNRHLIRRDTINFALNSRRL